MPIYNATPVIYVKLQKNSPSDDPVQDIMSLLSYFPADLKVINEDAEKIFKVTVLYLWFYMKQKKFHNLLFLGFNFLGRLIKWWVKGNCTFARSFLSLAILPHPILLAQQQHPPLLYYEMGGWRWNFLKNIKIINKKLFFWWEYRIVQLRHP